MNEPAEEPCPPPIEQERRDAAHKTKSRAGAIWGGCFFVLILLAPLVIVVCAGIGLITGYLFLPLGRGRPLELEGTPARIVSLIVLMLIGAIIILAGRRKRKNRRPKILGDRDYQ